MILNKDFCNRISANLEVSELGSVMWQILEATHQGKLHCELSEDSLTSETEGKLKDLGFTVHYVNSIYIYWN